MSAFALDPVYNDFVFTSGRMSLVTGAAELAQKLNARLEFVKGEWFLDTNQGTPWFQALLVKNPSIPALTQILRGIILSTPGAKAILSMPVAFDRANRVVTWGPMVIQHDSGAQIVGGRGQPFIVDTSRVST